MADGPSLPLFLSLGGAGVKCPPPPVDGATHPPTHLHHHRDAGARRTRGRKEGSKLQVSKGPSIEVYRSKDPRIEGPLEILGSSDSSARRSIDRSISASLWWKGLLGGSGRVLGYDPGMLLLLLLLPVLLLDRAPAGLHEPTDSGLWM
jgi:hypothetical protein